MLRALRRPECTRDCRAGVNECFAKLKKRVPSLANTILANGQWGIDGNFSLCQYKEQDVDGYGTWRIGREPRGFTTPPLDTRVTDLGDLAYLRKGFLRPTVSSHGEM
jgi:hypothetical protein